MEWQNRPLAADRHEFRKSHGRGHFVRQLGGPLTFRLAAAGKPRQHDLPRRCQAASAASSRPGNASTGREPMAPKAVVSPGRRADPVHAHLAHRRERAHSGVAPAAAGAAHHHDRIDGRIDQRVCEAIRLSRHGNAAPGSDGIGDAGERGIDEGVARPSAAPDAVAGRERARP